MILWFENSHGDMRQIAYCENWSDVNNSIKDFIDQANAAKGPGSPRFKSYYSRMWTDTITGMTKIDVGSWNEFFYVSEA